MLGGPAGLDQWLARRYEVDAALLVDSGTSALRLAIESLAADAPPAFEWHCPPTVATTLPPRPSARAPRSPSTMSIPPRSAPTGPRSARRSPPESMRVVLVHQYGIPVDLDRARALADAHGAVVIEDAAQGAGAWWRHRRLGAGVISAFSALGGARA